MRFFEFAGDDAGLDKFVMILKNHIGRASSKKAPSKLNWNALQNISTNAGFEFAADYETFKSMYDSNPTIQGLVKNFDKNGIELNVPGAEEPGDANEPIPNGGKDSAQTVDKIAASAAPAQLAQATATPQV
jgi:hypothetical protein